MLINACGLLGLGLLYTLGLFKIRFHPFSFFVGEGGGWVWVLLFILVFGFMSFIVNILVCL